MIPTFSATTHDTASQIADMDEAIARLSRTLEDASEALAPRDIERFFRTLTTAKEGLVQQAGMTPNAGYTAANVAAARLAELERRRVQYLAAGTKQLTQQKALLDAMGRAAGATPPILDNAAAASPEKKKKKQEKGAGAGVQAMVQQLSSQFMSLSRAADPFVATATLEDSFQALKIEIGAGLLPVLDAVSLRLQRLAKWYKTLGDTTKIVVTGTIAAAAGFTALTYAARALWPAIAIGVKGLVLLASAAYAHPLVALATIVGGLAAAWYLVGRNARDAGGAMGAAGKAGVGAGPGGPADHLGGLDPDDRRRVEKAGAGGHAAKAAELLKMQAENDKALQAEQDKYAKKMAGAGKFRALQAEAQQFLEDEEEKRRKSGYAGFFFGAAARRKGLNIQVFGTRKLPELQDAFKQAGATFPKGRDFWQALPLFNFSTSAPLDFLKKRQQTLTAAGEAIGTDELKRSYRGLPMPQITRPEAVADSVQIAALKTMGGSQEAENLARQLELAFGAKMVQALEKMDVHLEQIKRFVDPGWGY